MAEQIHIGFGIDKNFGRFAGITITSLVHNNIQHDLNIHIVYDELLPEDVDMDLVALVMVKRVYKVPVVQPVLTDRRARRPKPMVCMPIMAL